MIEIWNTAAICGIMTSSVIMIGMALSMMCMLVNSVLEASQDRKNDATHERLHSELYQLDHWLSHDFPIVEELTDYLRERMNESTSVGISDFRDGLREKYDIQQSSEDTEQE